MTMSLPCSYSPNYYSIEDILATQERIPCEFIQNVPNLGKLDPSSEGEDLKSGTTLELPYWLVKPLASGKQPVLSVDLPKVYKETYREILKADANAIDLHKFNMNFYDLGCYVKHFDMRGEVEEVLVQTFKNRFRHLMNLCEQTFNDPGVIDKLDAMERRLYRDGHQARLKLNTWLNESKVAMQAADMVVNHKKRKRTDLEDDQ